MNRVDVISLPSDAELAQAAAREVWVLASGGGKEAALRESLKPDGQTPLSRVLQTHPKPKVFTDIHQR